MIVYVNGRFVPAENATVSVFDRGFLYGDGLFESIRVHQGHLFLWESHAERLLRGAAALHIRLPEEPSALRTAAVELLRQNQLTHAILRISVSRGPGPRGYSIRGANSPTVVITAHPAPDLPTTSPPAWRLHTARVRLPARDPFAAYKTACKLTHVLARAEAEDAGADEALLLNTDGHLAETSAANLFWLQQNTAYTPHLDAGGLAGVTRGFLLRLLHASGWEVRETLAPPETLFRASGVFLTVSTLGLVDISHLDQRPLAQDPRLPELRAAYHRAVREHIERPPH